MFSDDARARGGGYPLRSLRLLINKPPGVTDDRIIYGQKSTGLFLQTGELLRNRAVQIDRVCELLLLDVLAFGVRDVNRSRTNQHRLSPVREEGNIRGEGGNHRGQTIDSAQAQKGNLQRKRDVHLIAGSRENLPAQIVRRTDEAIEQVRMSIIWDDIRRAS